MDFVESFFLTIIVIITLGLSYVLVVIPSDKDEDE